jgi:hypothetical protein
MRKFNIRFLTSHETINWGTCVCEDDGLVSLKLRLEKEALSYKTPVFAVDLEEVAMGNDIYIGYAKSLGLEVERYNFIATNYIELRLLTEVKEAIKKLTHYFGKPTTYNYDGQKFKQFFVKKDCWIVIRQTQEEYPMLILKNNYDEGFFLSRNE